MRALVYLLMVVGLWIRGADGPAASDHQSLASRLTIIQPMLYSGMCDASAGVAISSNIFAVASDEDNILRLYRTDQAGGPVKQFDVNAFLEIRGKSVEADLEGAARIGNRAFWIGSHGLNKDGKLRLNRRRLFATDIQTTDAEIKLVPVGKPYTRLLGDLAADSRFDQFHLEAAVRLAPKETGALNIEGLSATPEGQLLIGFRNPIPSEKALLIPLLNPNQVIEGTAARFGPPILLDLGGLGIRDIAWHAGKYVIIAGSYHGGGHFQLYRWAGPGTTPEPVEVEHLNDYHPEGLVIYPERGLRQFQILSDDGTTLVDGCPCKDLKDQGKQTFRSFWVAP